MDGNAALRMNPRLAGSGPAPVTPLAFHRVHDFVHRRGVPAFRAPNRAQGLPGLLDAIEQGIRHFNFGGQGAQIAERELLPASACRGRDEGVGHTAVQTRMSPDVATKF
ncbi:hypothetical protein MTO96_041928 [Rhipicephalus appendiculatus]